MRSPIRLALVLIAATVAGPTASAATFDQRPVAQIVDGTLVCVRTARDARVVLEVRVLRPSSDPARDEEARKFLDWTIPPQVERDWVEWLPIWLGPKELIDGRLIGQVIMGQPKIDCLRYKNGDPLPFELPPGTFMAR